MDALKKDAGVENREELTTLMLNRTEWRDSEPLGDSEMVVHQVHPHLIDWILNLTVQTEYSASTLFLCLILRAVDFYPVVKLRAIVCLGNRKRMSCYLYHVPKSG